MRTLIAVLAAITAIPAQEPTDYVVLAAFAEADPFDAAAARLAEHRHAPILRFDPADLEPVRRALTAAAPRNVALVMRPEQIEFGFARRFLQLATEVDDDPFVDFAFGYITGRTADDALALVHRGIDRTPKATQPTVAMVAGGGGDRAFASTRRHTLRRLGLDALQLYCAADPDFVAEQLPKIAGRDTVTFVGHGWPREVVDGPGYADLADLRLDGAVALNVACYTGVTNLYFQDDYRAGVSRRQEVPLDESFCLALLRTGVVGYTAYLCPRPAGPELDTDLAALLADGLSLGEARRRDYDKTVLGFLGFGEERLDLDPVSDGDRIGPNRDAVRDMMLEGATGGVLFGDPAVVPFTARPGESPVALEVEAVDGGLRIDARASLRVLYLHCSDPTARFGKTMAMKVHARVPLGALLVEEFVVDDLRIGSSRVPSRVLWAIEDDHGERFLQLKVNFPRLDAMVGSLSMTARVRTTDDADAARARGGEVQRPRAASQDVRSREVQPAMLERAQARDVSPEALQAALDASAALLGDASVPAGSVDRLGALGSEGFRAVCALLEVGHSHYRTWKLLEATWRPGDERHLIALATFDDLPNYASWQVLEGLGVADTPEVRAFLLERLETEEGAGLFMSTAEGLAHLGVREAVAPIGDRILEFRAGWSGVEPFLIDALVELGGPDAVEFLERIAVDPGAGAWQRALSGLDRLDAAAAARVRARRNGR